MLETMSPPAAVLPPLDLCYAPAETLSAPLDARVLAVIGYGADFEPGEDPRVLRVALEPLSTPSVEVWRSTRPVDSGRVGALRWSCDGDYRFVAVEIDEVDDDIGAAAQAAYAQLVDFIEASSTPHILRLWNFIDAINQGEGDEERYRRFCEGRALGMTHFHDSSYPAATAIGGHDGRRRLLVYGLAARLPGTPIENPRQVSAWRYPRQYGRTAPTFARAMSSAAGQLLISGTAAVVGHASRHEADLAAQIAETLANLDSVVGAAQGCFGSNALLKVYLREAADAAVVSTAVARHAPEARGVMLLAGDICRRELLVEIDGMQGLLR